MNNNKHWREGAVLDLEHKNALKEASIKERKVLLVKKGYEKVDDILDYAMTFNSTYELVDYLIDAKITKNTNRATILSNITNVANGLAKGLNRSLNRYRVYIEDINFTVNENDEIEFLQDKKNSKDSLDKDIVEEIILIFEEIEKMIDDLFIEEIIKSFETDKHWDKAILVDKISKKIEFVDLLFKILEKKSNYVKYDGLRFADYTCYNIISKKENSSLYIVDKELYLLKSKIKDLRGKIS